MNTKKNKNKNRPNKPPNPNPPQKVEEVVLAKKEEEVRQIAETITSASKTEERVPEIISDVFQKTVLDSEEKNDEMPKKPKRNRGKKKNQDSDSQIVKVESDVLPEVVLDTPDVAPNVPKKKNKGKKSTDLTADMSKKSDDNNTALKEEKEREKITITEIVEVKEQTGTSTIENPPEQEGKSSKKKNKKKKHRTDSEKSEKMEEPSCISAFQKLLKDENSDVIKVDKVEDIVSNTSVSKEKHDSAKKICSESDMKNKNNDAEVIDTKLQVVSDSSTQSVSESGQGKKKNKKDKKNLQRKEIPVDVISDTEAKTTIETILEPSSLQFNTSNIEKNILITETLPQIDVLENIIFTDDLSEAKAKIAKPVERKRKGKESNTIKDIKADNFVKDCDTIMVEQKLQETSAPIHKDDKQLQNSPAQFEEAPDLSTDHHPMGEIKVIAPDFRMEEKRKKSPKPKIQQPTIDSNPTTEGSESSQKVELFTEKVISEMEAIPEEKRKCQAVETVPKAEPFEEDVKKKEKSKKKTKNRISKSSAEKNICTEELIPDEESFMESFTKEEKEIPNIPMKVVTPCNIISLEDVEIRSLKADESEGSDICGFTPDILHPRAISQDFTDDNNNMSIQEIIFVEETNLRIPVVIPDTPLICGSGETPTTEIKFTSIKNKDDNLKTDQSSDIEKTDLKSKMMEVNQDMEELRMSIEKSLAEFTALEKIENEAEKEFANKMSTFSEKTPTINVKQEMPSEIIAKTKSEKDEVPLQDISKIQESSFGESKPQVIQDSFVVASLDSEQKGKKVKNITESISPAATELVDIPKSPEKVEERVSLPENIAKKEHKNKGKSKKKGKQDSVGSSSLQSESGTTPTERTLESEKTRNEQKPQQKPDSSGKEGKQQSELSTADSEKSQTEEEFTADNNKCQSEQELNKDVTEFDPIENFEDAMTSSADDINKSFEMIANETNQVEASHVNPEINITAPAEDKKQEVKNEKIKPVSQPKNLLGHPDIPVRSSKMDYKKEKNKSPNETLAKVKIKDSIAVEAKRESKESQTDNIRKYMKNKSIDESISLVDDNEDFVYKYNFRKVFLQSACHVCKKDLKQLRVACSYCNLVFYCSVKHKDEDWPQHQALCFAVSTIGHLKDQKHIYADAKNVTGQNYRLLRMQMIVSCEKVLKRRLLPWEQEALLYPRICADVSCREWQQSKLVDCDGCSQISYCSAHPDHLPKSHQRWCKSYSLYQKLVSYQQTKGRLELKLPSKVLMDYQMPEKINEVLASMYEEKIDMSDIQYAALTQMATAPLTTAYCYQVATKSLLTNGIHKKSSCTIHVVDPELQFEADALNKWEIFFLHLVPVHELRVVMVSTDLNPGNLPLELLSKIKLCESCRVNKRRVVFNFHDKQSYYEYWTGEEYVKPNIVCAFNANIERSSMYNVKADPWPKTISCVFKQKVPFLVTAHTLNELHKDLARIKQYAEQKFNVIVEPKINSFASIRPDRNFITDDEVPLLFKNYCYAFLIGLQ